MKKLLILSAMCMAMTAQATILRVSNRTNSGAPYSNIYDAISAAEEGDTIMVDGSNSSYGSVTITKRIVMIGPGYLLNTNGVIAEGSPSAQISGIGSNYNGAAGSIIMGMDITGTVAFAQPNMVLTRCRIAGDVNINTSASNCIIHQNYITNGRVMCTSTSTTSWAPSPQITNNIFTKKSNSVTTGLINAISNGTIAYNTFTQTFDGDNAPNLKQLTGCTVEHNIFVGEELTLDGNTLQDNYWSGNGGTFVLEECTTDRAIKEASESEFYVSDFSGKGAFAGNDPYVISGIPAGPYISDVTVPTSVEQGQTLKVNVKLGVQQ